VHQRLLPRQASIEPSPSSGILNSNVQTIARSYPTAESATRRRKTNVPREREKPEENISKKGGRTKTLLAFFLLLQVMVVITAGAERERRRKHTRSTDLLGFARGGM